MPLRLFEIPAVILVLLVVSACGQERGRTRGAARSHSPGNETDDSAGGSLSPAPHPATWPSGTPVHPGGSRAEGGGQQAAPTTGKTGGSSTATHLAGGQAAIITPADSLRATATSKSSGPRETAPVAGASPAAALKAATASSVAGPALPHEPFAMGERLDYQVKYGFFSVGNASMQVMGIEELRGVPVLHTRLTVQGGSRIYRVDDQYESWFDPRTFSSIRFLQKIDEGSYEKERSYEIYPDRSTYSENNKPEAATVVGAMDEGTFLYFLRTIPLEVGKTYEFARYFQPDRNPVTVIVLRREAIHVPAGTFNTIVVRPIIKTKGIFSEGGRAQVWFSDDSTRQMVQMKSQLKFGSLSLQLKAVHGPLTRTP